MSTFLHHLLLGAGGLSLLLQADPVLAAPPGADKVRIGIRIDARPFIWKDADTGKYLGFLWDICTEGVQRAGYTFDEAEVDATARARFLDDGTGGFDLLCDPTTITLKRVENFATGKPVHLEFSPIVFVASSSYVENVRNRKLSGAEIEKPPDCRELILRNGKSPGPADSETDPGAGAGKAKTWLQRMEQRFDFTLYPPTKEDAPAQRRFEMWGYVGGTTSSGALGGDNLPKGEPYPTIVCPQRFPSHSQAAAALCEGGLDRYYGDTHIAQAAIDDYIAHSGRQCDAKAPTPEAPIAYEPYAFVVSSRLPDFPERFSLALYGMFRDRTIERLFNGHFADVQKSQNLATLFLLNSIPLGTEDQTDPDAAAVAAAGPKTGP